jgi:hypothetical protein
LYCPPFGSWQRSGNASHIRWLDIDLVTPVELPEPSIICEYGHLGARLEELAKQNAGSSPDCDLLPLVLSCVVLFLLLAHRPPADERR